MAIVYPNTWAGSSEDLASCQLVTQSRKGEKLLALVHRYISMGKLISLGVAGQEDLFARFAYNGDSSLTSEEHRRKETSTFTRRFVYNSVGFHTDGGYGQPAFGNGHISRITFKVH